MDKELLFSSALDDAEVEISRGKVRVRGLSRAEIHGMNRGKDPNPTLVEQRTVQLGLVDPELTLDEVQRWYTVAPAGDIQKIVNAVLDLSGMTDGADKEAYRQFRDES